jgi:uncharacterized protein
MPHFSPYSGFQKSRLVVSGKLAEVALAVRGLSSDAHPEGVLIFDNASGRVVDVDFRGTDADVLARLPAESALPDEPAEDAPRGPGRPKLGVVAKEVTLLPRHWEWLSAQPGGASVALRKLVDDARRANAGKDRIRQAQERAYRFLSAMLADAANLEEAQRALFAGQKVTFEDLSSTWPPDLRRHVLLLAEDAWEQS